MKSTKKILKLLSIFFISTFALFFAAYHLFVPNEIKDAYSEISKIQNKIKNIDPDTPEFQKGLIVDGLFKDLEKRDDQKERIIDHEEIGRVYSIPSVVIYIDNYDEKNINYSNYGGTTASLDLLNDYTVGRNLTYKSFNNFSPNIKYSLPGAQYEILEVYKFSERSNIYVVEDDNGIKSYVLDFKFYEFTKWDDSGDFLKNKTRLKNDFVDMSESGSQRVYLSLRSEDLLFGEIDESDIVWSNLFKDPKEKIEESYSLFHKKTLNKFKDRAISYGKSYPFIEMDVTPAEFIELSQFVYDNGIKDIYEKTESNLKLIKKESSREMVRNQDWYSIKKDEYNKLIDEFNPFILDEDSYVRIKEELLQVPEAKRGGLVKSGEIPKVNPNQERNKILSRIKLLKIEANFLNTSMDKYKCDLGDLDLTSRLKYMKTINSCINFSKSNKAYREDEAWVLWKITETNSNYYKGTFAYKKFEYPYYSLREY